MTDENVVINITVEAEDIPRNPVLKRRNNKRKKQIKHLLQRASMHRGDVPYVR